MYYTNPKSDAYQEGRSAYRSWSWSGGSRPDNPYRTGDVEGEPIEYDEWQQGWDDASFDD